MTISTQDSKVNYQGNGQTTVFQIPFPFLENNQIYVQKKDAEGNLINYTYATDYTVTGAGEENGGSVTLNVAPEQGSTISIYRNVPLTQEVDYRENEIFPAETHEEALDKLTMEVQQIQEQLDRSVKVDRFSDSDVDLDIFINEIERVYDSTDNIDIVANNINDVNTVADNIANVNTTATNIVAIQYAPTAATNAANSATASANSAKAAQDAADKVQGLIATPIGTIFQSVYVDESLDIARQLNGQLISSTKFTGFRSWLNTVQTASPNLFTTETNWQAEKTNSKLGQCGKFVVDDTAGTIRLPCVVNAQGLADLALIGGIKSESLPTAVALVGYNGVSGEFRQKVANYTYTSDSHQGNTSAPKSSETTSGSQVDYLNDKPVQQEAVQYPYYIQVATGVEETLPAIREYQINTPFFFGQSMYSDVAPDNASWLVSNGQYNARSVYPDYYDWLVKQMNKGVDRFKGTTAYQFKGNTTETEAYTPSFTTRNPVVGSAIYGGSPIQVLGHATQVNADGSVVVQDVVNNITATLVFKQELPNINWFTDYDFVINTTDQTFRLPLKNGQEGVFADGVKGNGISIGLSCKDGTNLALGGQSVKTDNGYSYYLASQVAKYGSPVGTDMGGFATPAANTTFGLTTDPSKSGMIVDKTVPSGWNLYYYVGDTVQDASLINAGAVLGQLANVNAASRGYVVESYHNGTEWYRIYSDGWCEQGFYDTNNADHVVTLLTPMADANYIVSIGQSGDGASAQVGRSTWKEKTATTLKIKSVTPTDWVIAGYKA